MAQDCTKEHHSKADGGMRSAHGTCFVGRFRAVHAPRGGIARKAGPMEEKEKEKEPTPDPESEIFEDRST